MKLDAKQKEALSKEIYDNCKSIINNSVDKKWKEYCKSSGYKDLVKIFKVTEEYDLISEKRDKLYSELSSVKRDFQSKYGIYPIDKIKSISDKLHILGLCYPDYNIIARKVQLSTIGKDVDIDELINRISNEILNK